MPCGSFFGASAQGRGGQPNADPFVLLLDEMNPTLFTFSGHLKRMIPTSEGVILVLIAIPVFLSVDSV